MTGLHIYIHVYADTTVNVEISIFYFLMYSVVFRFSGFYCTTYMT